MPTDTSEPFQKMAEDIRHMGDRPFGGAYVLVAPDGTILADLSISASADAGEFWGSMLTRIQKAVADIDEKARLATTFGRVR